jgi:hypothetical protein
MEKTYVALLTEEQKESLVGKTFAEDSYFNPVQDKGENWVISVEEQEFCNNEEFLWIKSLPLIEYEAPDVDMISF